MQGLQPLTRPFCRASGGLLASGSGGLAGEEAWPSVIVQQAKVSCKASVYVTAQVAAASYLLRS